MAALSVEEKFAGLRPFLPEGAFEKVLVYFKDYRIFLKITRERKTILGDYRAPTREKPVHQISVNGSLNPYSFLVTLLHEIAHLLAHVEYGHKIAPHGTEWKKIFKRVLARFLNKELFPADVEAGLKNSLSGLKATTCSDVDLYRILKKYDKRPRHIKFVEEFPAKSLFQTSDGRKFQMLEKMRTRYRCKEVKTGKLFYFHPMVEVSAV
jgi:hypothetical protein